MMTRMVSMATLWELERCMLMLMGWITDHWVLGTAQQLELAI